MKHISFFNISPIQFFHSRQDDDIEVLDEIQVEDMDDIEVLDEIQEKDIEVAETLDEIQAEDIDFLITPDNEINMDHFDQRKEDILIDLPFSPQVESRILNICPNTPETPTGSPYGVIAKISVVLAQLVIPINITSFIDLPQEAFDIKDINKRLKLRECILLQPTNILFVRGFINNSMKYSTMNCSNPQGVCGKVSNYIIDIPFECSTAVNFFTQPLDPILNTKEVFNYSGTDVPELNQISQEFFNELPFCKLLSSQIIESDKFIIPKSPNAGFMKIEETMVIELRMEILQNQPIIIPPTRKN